MFWPADRTWYGFKVTEDKPEVEYMISSMDSNDSRRKSQPINLDSSDSDEETGGNYTSFVPSEN